MCGGVFFVRLLVVHERLLLLVRQADLVGLLLESVLLLLICFISRFKISVTDENSFFIDIEEFSCWLFWLMLS